MLGLDTAKALYRSHFIAPGRSSASRSNDLREHVGQGDTVYLEVQRGAFLLPFIRETMIDATVNSQRIEDGKIQTREIRTGFAVYSILGFVPFARRYASTSFRDFDGRKGSANEVDAVTLNKVLDNTTRRKGAVTNY